jgi:hypothetical protein
MLGPNYKLIGITWMFIVMDNICQKDAENIKLLDKSLQIICG